MTLDMTLDCVRKKLTRVVLKKYLSESAVHRHLLSDERCRVSYRDSDFSVLFRARSRAQLEVLESVCIALYKPNLCVQKLVSFSLLQDLSLSK